MRSIVGYKDLVQIYESQYSVLYKAERTEDNKPVIIKILSAKSPLPEQIFYYNNEYEFTKDVNSRYIRKAIKQDKIQNRYALILEDFDSFTLKEIFSNKRFLINDLMKVALALTEALEEIHSLDIIHKNITSTNILISKKYEHGMIPELKVIDFGISSRIDLKSYEIIHPEKLEGSLSYISPEQTSRMNRVVDFRSDLYSLGVVLFELFTGALPFTSTDPIELVHHHIAHTPPFPKDINKEIPAIVSEMIVKLLSKNAEDRYKSAAGLKADIVRCLERGYAVFNLGEEDIPAKLIIPEKLYGRENEILELFNSYQNICKGKKNAIIISSSPGTGKTALVHEISRVLKLTKNTKSYFLSGSFSEPESYLPYAPWRQVFQSFVRYVFSGNTAVVSDWKHKILEAVEDNGKVLTDVFPEIELIIGVQPEVPRLEGNEQRNRFHYVLSSFVRSLASEKNPIVIFIENWHRADIDSIELLNIILADSSINYLLFVGTYRPDVPGSLLPFRAFLDGIGKDNAEIQIKNLENLKMEDVEDFLSDTLKISGDKKKELSEIIFNKTDGNPFFVKKILKYLYREKLLIFNKNQWNWDKNKISEVIQSFNKADLVSGFISSLSDSIKKSLQTAACIGSKFNLDLVGRVSGIEERTLALNLKEAIKQGIILPIGEGYRYAQQEIYGASSFSKAEYIFLHDSVRDCLYSLLTPEEKCAVHFKIAEALEKEPVLSQNEANLFSITYHFNQTVSIPGENFELPYLSELNYKSALKARRENAFHLAFDFYQRSIRIAGDSIFESDYEFAFKNYSGILEAAYLSGKFSVMEDYFLRAISHAANKTDKAILYNYKILSLLAEGLPEDAVKTAVKILKELDVYFPEVCDSAAVQKEMERTLTVIAGRSFDELLGLPEMKNEEKIAASRILFSMFTAASIISPARIPFIFFNQVILSIEYGNTALSAFAYVNFGSILSKMTGDIPAGREFGNLALKLIDRLNAVELKARIGYFYNWFIRPFSEPIKNALPDLLTSFKWGLRTGDIEYASRSLHCYIFYSYLSGRELSGLEKEIKEYSGFIHSLKQKAFGEMLAMCIEAISSLRKEKADPGMLEGDYYNEKIKFPVLLNTIDREALRCLYLHKIILHIHFEEYEKSASTAMELAKYPEKDSYSILTPEFYFYKSLVVLLNFESLSKKQKKQELLEVVENQKMLLKLAEHSPLNYSHKHRLIEAELARVKKKEGEARRLYDEAVSLSKISGCAGEESLALQLAAKFYKELENEFLYRVYLDECRQATFLWGASAKLTYLENKNSQTRKIKETSFFPDSNLPAIKSNTNSDLAGIMKIIDSLSSELVLEKLIEKILTLIIENAGATRGILFLKKEGKWVLDACADYDGLKLTTRVLLDIPLEDANFNAPDFPLSIVKYSVRRSETVIIHDVIKESEYASDPYVMEKLPRSILVMPLRNKEAVNALIYLENNQMPGAFSGERIQVLSLLSSWLSISIENASLFTSLQKSFDYRAKLAETYIRFVPQEFLSLLEKDSIFEILPGEQVQKEMTVLFSDIRNFNSISEYMNPAENFRFINEYLGRIEPLIAKNNGFIYKYIGDAVVALFPGTADEALESSIEMLAGLNELNRDYVNRGMDSIEIGIGLNSGRLILGTISGGHGRIDGAVISDAVNISSRIENLAKEYGVSLLIGEKTYYSLSDPEKYNIRFIDSVKIKGKSNYFSLFEVFDNDPHDILNLKIEYNDLFEYAVSLYHFYKVEDAKSHFERYADLCPKDPIGALYLSRCNEFLESGKYYGDNSFKERVTWTDDLSIDMASIDTQHKELFRRINLLLEKIKEGDAYEKTRETIEFLEDYTITHFGMEEALMMSKSYPEFRAHKEQHEKFKKELHYLKNVEIFRGKFKLPMILRLRSQVVNWFIEHILKVDSKLARFLKAKKS